MDMMVCTDANVYIDSNDIVNIFKQTLEFELCNIWCSLLVRWLFALLKASLSDRNCSCVLGQFNYIHNKTSKSGIQQTQHK